MAWTKPQEMVQLGRVSLVSIFPGSEKSREEGEPLYQKWMCGQRDGSQARASETSQTQADSGTQLRRTGEAPGHLYPSQEAPGPHSPPSREGPAAEQMKEREDLRTCPVGSGPDLDRAG